MSNENTVGERLCRATFNPIGQRFDPEQLVGTDLTEAQLDAARVRTRITRQVKLAPEPTHINIKIELPATLSTFNIEQKFDGGFDPDRIATAFSKDLLDIAKRRAEEPVRVFQGDYEIETVVLAKQVRAPGDCNVLEFAQPPIDALTSKGYTLDRVEGELAVFTRRKPVAPASRPR